MKLAIVNQPLANRGDEAAHKAFVRELAKAFPESSIDVIFLGIKDTTLIGDIRVEAANVCYRDAYAAAFAFASGSPEIPEGSEIL